MKGVDELVGAPIVAGTVVTAKGRGKALLGGAVAGALGGAVAQVGARMATERSNAGASPLPANALALGYLAVTADELVVLQGKQGLMKPKAEKVIATAPRAALRSVELGDGALAKPLVLRFTDDIVWEFEIPRVQVKGAESVVAALHRA